MSRIFPSPLRRTNSLDSLPSDSPDSESYSGFDRVLSVKSIPKGSRLIKRALTPAFLKGQFSCFDFFRVLGALGSILVIFGSFFILAKTYLAKTFPACGGGTTDCSCASFSTESFRFFIRSAINFLPSHCFFFGPHLYYVSQDYTLVACWFLSHLGATLVVLFFSNVSFAIQGCFIQATTLLLYNSIVMGLFSEDIPSKICLLNAVLVLMCFLQLTLYALTFLGSSCYTYMLPSTILFLEALWLAFTRYESDVPPFARTLVWAHVLGMLSGLHFTTFLCLPKVSSLFISAALLTFISVLFKMWPRLMGIIDPNLIILDVQHLMIFEYCECVPIVVYLFFYFTDYSPFSQLVNTSAEGCYGYPIVSEFKERYQSIFVLLGSKIATSCLALPIMLRNDLGKLVIPFRFNSWTQCFLLWGSALTGCLFAFEASGMVIKNSISSDLT